MRQLLLLLAVFVLSCVAPGQGKGSVDPAGFEARLGEKDAQLLDVRTAGEFQGGHLADARNYDWTNGELKSAVPNLDKTKPVLLYCASGRRSAAAREYLLEQGFTDVVDMAGGIGAWTNAGRPVVQ
ncbi:MAG: rhodanese-like domain-containing protein [Flavobacteriales bacterium]|nr:rhodanese-like domain-containing protein [Flavobacteriales bacterium]